MLAVNNSKQILLFIASLLLLWGYEYNARSGLYMIYPLMGLSLLLLISLMEKSNFYRLNAERTFLLSLIISMAFLYALLAQLYGELFTQKNYTPLKPIFQLIIFSLVVFIIPKVNIELLFKVNCIVLSLLSIISIFIYFKGQFLFWGPTNLRFSSIFRDPNFAGVCFGFGVISALFFKRRIVSLIVFSLCFTGLLLTYSKSAIISALLSLGCFYFVSKGYKFKSFIMLFVISMILFINFVMSYLIENYELLRVGTGMNKRDVYINEGFDALYKNPFEGRTLQDVMDITSLWGENTSLHNTLLESAFYYGLPYVFFLVAVCVYVGYYFYKKKNWLFFTLLIYILISSNSFTFMFGSIGALSMYWMFVVGYAFYDEK